MRAKFLAGVALALLSITPASASSTSGAYVKGFKTIGTQNSRLMYVFMDGVRMNGEPPCSNSSIPNRWALDPTKLQFAYDGISFYSKSKPGSSGEICITHATAYRISSVRNSYGYELPFNYDNVDTDYDPNDPRSMVDVTTWSTVKGVSAANLATGASNLASESFG